MIKLMSLLIEQLNEKAKWRSSSAATKVGDPFGARADAMGQTTDDTPDYLKAKSDTDLPGGALQQRRPAQVATQGPRKGMATKQSIQRTKSNIQQYGDTSGVPDASPAPDNVQKAASKQAGGKVVFGKYYDASGKYLGKSSGGKWVDAAQEPDAEIPKQKSTTPKGIAKDAHSDPKVSDRVASAMSKFKINQDGYGGGFEWDDATKTYNYDDNEGGFEYYASVKPLDNDEYEVGYGERSGKKPVRVKGLKGVKKHLESED